MAYLNTAQPGWLMPGSNQGFSLGYQPSTMPAQAAPNLGTAVGGPLGRLIAMNTGQQPGQSLQLAGAVPQQPAAPMQMAGATPQQPTS